MKKHRLENGNRGRIISLGIELEERVPGGNLAVRCIADSDFDFVLRSRYEYPYVLYTDYTSLELYTFNLESLAQGSGLGFRFPVRNVHFILESCASVLSQIFVARAATKRLGWKVKLVSFTGSCEATEIGWNLTGKSL